MDFFNKKLIIAVMVLLIMAFAGGNWYSQKLEEKQDNKSEELIIIDDPTINEEEKIELQNIIVYVTGAVVNPDVYTLTEGARLFEAVEKAGGLLSDADLKQIPMARIIEDQETIYIPTIGEAIEISTVTHNTNSAKININKANADELTTLNGIGEALANRIVDYRESKGSFKDISEIQNVSGIGEKKYDVIKDDICVK